MVWLALTLIMVGLFVIPLLLNNSILIMLGLISILVIAHEMGHFYVAKRAGVKVERFGLGLPFGPTLWAKQIGETEYCLHLLLFGGYVSFPDDNPDSPIPADSTERFENQPLLNRAAIAIAGVTVNAILGWAIMFFVILQWGVPSLHDSEIGIAKTLSPTTPAAIAGIKGGERILAINNQDIETFPAEKRLASISDIIKHSPGKAITLRLEKRKQVFNIPITPDATGKIGIQFSIKRKFVPVDSPVQAAGEAVSLLGEIVSKNFEALGKLVSGSMDPKELGGPIRIVDVGARMIDIGGIQEGLMMAAMISTILAVMNLLPIPALDGGHLLFILIEALKGSPLKKEFQERVVQFGFMALLALMAFILWNDVYQTWLSPTIPAK